MRGAGRKERLIMVAQEAYAGSMLARCAVGAVLAGLLALALGMCLGGCSQEQEGEASSASAPSASAASADAASADAASADAASISTPSAGAVSAVMAPAPDAEIEDVTTVAYLGPEGTYTQEAAKLFFGDNDNLIPQATVADALALVADGAAAYAVVPQENTLGGPVTEYIDAFLAAEGVSVVGEVVLPIRQTLMGLPGTDLSKVKRVLSHKQGLAQSSAWLDENLPDAVREEAASTAAAAQEVAEGNDPTAVAIAAPGAAELYKLEVLQDNVSQSQANKTRFYVVSARANELPGYECAVFTANISAADLSSTLDSACAGGAQIVCVHDRPEGSALGVYRYVIELSRENGFTDDEIARLSAEAGLEYLGRYSRVEG